MSWDVPGIILNFEADLEKLARRAINVLGSWFLD